MAATSNLPLLLPPNYHSRSQGSSEWKPSRYLSEPQPPPTDDTKQHDQEMAAARQLIDGKAVKKVRPRRTIDYFAGVGRWALVCT
jgi:polyadenylation factor subunit 2